MAVCEFYGSIHAEVLKMISSATISDGQLIFQALDSALPEFYAAVLVLLAKAREYFHRPTGKKLCKFPR